MRRESDLLERLRPAAERVFHGGPVLVAYAFGSRLTGTARSDSDLDVGYYLHEYRRGATMPLREEMQLAVELSDVLDIEVDIHNLGVAPLEFRGRVLEDGVRIYSSDEPQRVTLECELLARYHDHKDGFRRLHEERLRAIASRGL
ncbi:MAG: type VII toxin-antitoxin system MntA family adenylyltransferase antitoxin [Thermoanaerobaculia bacterium]